MALIRTGFLEGEILQAGFVDQGCIHLELN